MALKDELRKRDAEIRSLKQERNELNGFVSRRDEQIKITEAALSNSEDRRKWAIKCLSARRSSLLAELDAVEVGLFALGWNEKK